MSASPSIRAVVFDVGNVLLTWNPVLLYRDLLPGRKEIDDFLREVDFSVMNLRLDRGEDWDAVLDEYAQRFPHRAELLNVYRERWQDTIPGPVPGSLEIVEELLACEIPVYALTNFASHTWPVVRPAYSFFDRFRGIVVSCEERIVKPDPAIYHILLDRYELDPATVFYTDDLDVNVEAAIRMGIQATRFTDAASLRADLVRRGVLTAK